MCKIRNMDRKGAKARTRENQFFSRMKNLKERKKSDGGKFNLEEKKDKVEVSKEEKELLSARLLGLGIRKYS